MGPSILSYTNLREYLRDLFESLRRTEPGFSYRSFSKLVGSTAPNFLQLVLAGKLSPSDSAVKNLSRSLRLNRNETKYLRNLVSLARAAGHAEKQIYYRRLLEARKGDDNYMLAKDQYEYYSKWYYSALRALVGYAKIKKGAENFRGLSKKLVPAISPAQAKQAISLLERLGLIEADPFGYYRQSNRAITTGSGFRSVEVLNFQMETLRLAQLSLESCPVDLRDISTLTINISQKGYVEIRDRIAAFRKELADLACRDNQDDRVYQVNLQLFPLSVTNNKD